MNSYSPFCLLASIMLAVVTSSVYEYDMPSKFNGIIELAILHAEFEEMAPNPNPDPNPDPSPAICDVCDNTGYIYIETDDRTRKIQCTNDDCPYWKNRTPEIPECTTCDHEGYILLPDEVGKSVCPYIKCTNPNCSYWQAEEPPPIPTDKSLVPDISPPKQVEIKIDGTNYNYVYVNGEFQMRAPPPLEKRNYVSAKWVDYDVWQECYGNHCKRFRIKTDKKENLGLAPEQYKNVVNR